MWDFTLQITSIVVDIFCVAFILFRSIRTLYNTRMKIWFVVVCTNFFIFWLVESAVVVIHTPRLILFVTFKVSRKPKKLHSFCSGVGWFAFSIFHVQLIAYFNYVLVWQELNCMFILQVKGYAHQSFQGFDINLCSFGVEIG